MVDQIIAAYRQRQVVARGARPDEERALRLPFQQLLGLRPGAAVRLPVAGVLVGGQVITPDHVVLLQPSKVLVRLAPVFQPAVEVRILSALHSESVVYFIQVT